VSGTYVSTNRVYDNAAILASDLPPFAHYLTIAGDDVVRSGKLHFVGPDQRHGVRVGFTPDIGREALVTYNGS
jgi:choline-sulfatase